MTGWVGLIAVALAYLSLSVVLAAEKLRAGIVRDDQCSCGCDVYNQEEDAPLQIEVNLAFYPVEVLDFDIVEITTPAARRTYSEAEAIWSATVIGQDWA